MKPSKCLSIFNISVVAKAAIVYITDMPDYALLAPCCRSGIFRAIQMLTFGQCPDGPTQLQSCVCTKDDNSSLLRNSVTLSVQGQCETGTEDAISAGSLYSQYCNQVVGQSPATTTNTKGNGGGVLSTNAVPGEPTSVADPERKSTPSATSTTTSSPTLAPTSTPTATRSIPLSPIIGGSVGFVILLIIVLLSIIRYRKRHLPQSQPTQLAPQQTPASPSLHTYNSEYTHNQNYTNIHHIHTPSPPPTNMSSRTQVGWSGSFPFSQQQSYRTGSPMAGIASTNSIPMLEMNPPQYQEPQSLQNPQQQQIPPQYPTSHSNWSPPRRNPNPNSPTDYVVEEM